MPPNLLVTLAQINLRIKLDEPQVKLRSLGSLQDLLANLQVQNHPFALLKRVVNK
jgi:sulfur carrier protein ThiS